MAVRCSACGEWIKTTGGTHDCPGKPKQHADVSTDDGMAPILGAVRLAEDFMVCPSYVVAAIEHGIDRCLCWESLAGRHKGTAFLVVKADLGDATRSVKRNHSS
ncbi:hypothetical protein PDE_09098 [Penicillium oxalicum 114-2]|uniref:Uncharacterized protein n=1 Tax=Penicillium oxalicum (strain 114-2 / CGMCC 5302) TaxID=933388 RepID=S7ZZ76_PENO1|nr:hypothetical protein PDE_09098 [Penicillium oxalicum 114-2]